MIQDTLIGKVCEDPVLFFPPALDFLDEDRLQEKYGGGILIGRQSEELLKISKKKPASLPERGFIQQKNNTQMHNSINLQFRNTICASTPLHPRGAGLNSS